MKKIEQLDIAKDLLGQALKVAYNSMPNNRTVEEARGHMKQAINKLDVVAKKQGKRKKMMQDQFQGWWGDIEAGTAQLANSPMSPEAQQKSLSQLNSMIDAEKQKLDDLAKQSEEIDDQLLRD